VPFIAICPYCHAGRIRAPEQALGLTAPCPRCHTSFTLVDSGESAFQPQPGKLEPARTVAEPAATVVIAQSVAKPAASEQPTAVFDATLPFVATIPTIQFVEDACDHEDATRTPTLFAFILAGVALVLSQIPYGRVGTIVFAGIGVVVALVCCFGTRRLRWPALATILNAGVILIITLLPSWLGAKSWRPDPIEKERKTVQTFGRDGLQPTSSEWVDNSQSWQFDDVRVRVIATLSPLELTGPKGQKKWTKSQYLQLKVAVANVGVARTIDVTGWDAKAPVRLTDATGKPVSLPTFETGWEPPPLRHKHKNLLPGEMVEHDLLFEAPTNPGEYFRLELSGVGCGVPEQTVRFQIPGRPLGYR
jgi:hypothetical protein